MSFARGTSSLVLTLKIFTSVPGIGKPQEPQTWVWSVLIVVAPVAGGQIDSKELFDFLEPRMAHFMLPRYIRIVAELPKTPTQKVQKHLLKSDGVTADTWDREDAGIKVKRNRVG